MISQCLVSIFQPPDKSCDYVPAIRLASTGPRVNTAAFAFAGDGHHHQRRVLRAADHLQLPHVQVAQHSR